MGFRLGLDCKLYYNSAVYATPTWVEITNVRDATLNREYAEADITTRGSNGFRETASTLQDAGVEFQMVDDPDDTIFGLIQAAFDGRTSMEFAVMNGPIDDVTSEGLRATMRIASFTRNEALEDATLVDVSIKPTRAANPPDWINGNTAW